MKLKISVSILIAGALMLFQNCGNVKFSDPAGTQTNAKLTAMEVGPNEQDLVTADGGTASAQNGDNLVPITPPMPPPPPITVVNPGTSENEISHSGSDGSDSHHGDSNHDHAMDSSDSSTDFVACILKDHGKSLKLAVTEDKLGGVHAVSKSACVSRHGCLDLVPAKFEVVGAYDRGYCSHNPNVIHLSDAELAALLLK